MGAVEILLLAAAALVGVAGSIAGAIALSERVGKRRRPHG